MQLFIFKNIVFLLCILFTYCSIRKTALADENPDENEIPSQDPMQENVYPKDFSENCLLTFK